MIKIFHTVNAGLYIDSGQTALLIDGIHEGPSVGLSAMPEGLGEQILEGDGMFSRLDGLLFTHLHVDPYDKEKVGRLLKRRPETALWGPGLACQGVQEYQAVPGDCSFRIGEFRIAAYITVHSADVFKDDPHRSFLIENEETGENVFISGDALFSPDLADTIKENTDGRSIGAAFINVFHLIEEPSREFLLRLAPERLFLYHYPDPEDDTFHYLSMIRTTLRRDPLPGHTVERLGHMQWVNLDSSEAGGPDRQD